jgi:hypothetical protein
MVGVFLTNRIAFLRRTVLHHDDFIVLERLPTEAFQQFIDFLRPVVDRYDD